MALAHNVDCGHRTEDVQISEDVTFDSLLLRKKTLEGLKNSGFCYPSPIQLLGIPLGKCGFDLLLEAKSGTGKTAVFTIIALEKLDISKGLQTIILAPTREIAAQICDVVKQIGSAFKDLSVEVVIGGLSLEDDIKKLKKKVHILVGSPGRMKHLIQLKYIDTSAIRLLIIDEADKLMEKSFIADINYIYFELPNQKQVIMSSATYPEDSKPFICNYVKNFQHICPESDSILKGVIQRVAIVLSSSNIVRQTQYRFEELLKILSKKQFKQCLIFCNYQVRVTELHRMLTREQWPAELLYSKQEQTDRLDALKTLQEYKCRILISTDLAARGIDASNVDLVINFEPPFEWQTYLHRIGRAGRFGSYGLAITLLSEGKEVNRFKNMLITMKNSITLKHFWTDESFELDSMDSPKVLTFSKLPETVIKKDFPHIEMTAEIWNVLTLGSTQNNNTMKYIECFNDLIDSYEHCAKIHVESFSTLIKSFDDMQVADKHDKTNFKTITINDLPIENILSVMSSSTITKVSSIFNNAQCDKNVNVTNENGIDINFEHTTAMPMQLNVSVDDNNKEEHRIDNIDIYKKKPKGNVSYTECANNNKLMLELGLPTCFSSSKRKENLNRKHNTHDTKEHNDTYQDPAISKNNQKNITLFTEANHGVVKTYNKSNAKSSSNGNMISSDDVKIHNRNQLNDLKLKKNEYILWYNQFKSHIKNLEIAYYLNEISNLY